MQSLQCEACLSTYIRFPLSLFFLHFTDSVVLPQDNFVMPYVATQALLGLHAL